MSKFCSCPAVSQAPHAIRRARRLLSLGGLLAALSGLPTMAEAGTTIDLNAEASRSASNDLARSTVFSEIHGNAPADVARQVNAQIAEALKLAKSYPAVKAQSGNTSTYPTYGKTNKIEGWQMRSEIVLESTDSTVLSELLGKLQGQALGVSGITFLPTAETRKKSESAALLDAIAAFKARAKQVAEAFGSGFEIKHLSLGGASRPEAPMLRRTAFAADAMTMPVESGESQISVSVSGQIELSSPATK